MSHQRLNMVSSSINAAFKQSRGNVLKRVTTFTIETDLDNYKISEQLSDFAGGGVRAGDILRGPLFKESHTKRG